jgi:peptidoglycan-N-acetylmuramic acid deacetylase
VIEIRNTLRALSVVLTIVFLFAACNFNAEVIEPSVSRVPVEILPVSADSASDAPATESPSPKPTDTPVAALEQTPQPTAAPKTEAPAETALDTAALAATSATEQAPYGGIDAGIKLALPENPNDPYALSYGSPITADNVFSNKKLSWYFGKNAVFQPPTAQHDFDIRQFNAYYLGNTNQRELYLTFDEGYENGFTPAILDTLRDKGIKAAFFVTKPFVQSNLDLVLRMIDEGHLVCSHTISHKSSPDLSDDELRYEIEGLAEYYKSVTGRDMDPYFRPPMGEYSARTLDITDKLGYKTIFWSFAYKDWEVNDQPTTQTAFTETVTHTHNGAVILLHAVSEANTRALPYIIDALKNNGFTFKTLDELPDYQ